MGLGEDGSEHECLNLGEHRHLLEECAVFVFRAKWGHQQWLDIRPPHYTRAVFNCSRCPRSNSNYSTEPERCTGALPVCGIVAAVRRLPSCRHSVKRRAAHNDKICTSTCQVSG